MVRRKLACSKIVKEPGLVGRRGCRPTRWRAELPLPPVQSWPETGALGLLSRRFRVLELDLSRQRTLPRDRLGIWRLRRRAIAGSVLFHASLSALGRNAWLISGCGCVHAWRAPPSCGLDTGSTGDVLSLRRECLDAELHRALLDPLQSDLRYRENPTAVTRGRDNV